MLHRREIRRSRARVGIALCYHRVDDPGGNPSRELVPALASSMFAAQVERLMSRYELVTASELWDAASSRPARGRIPAAITFDDDLPTHVNVAMPILLRIGAPATFFVSGASLRSPAGFWWERLQRAWDAGAVDGSWLRRSGLAPAVGAADIHRVAAAIEAAPPADRRRIDADLAALAGPDPRDAGMRADELRRLASAGFEIGFHTLGHDRLPDLADDELDRALRDGREALEETIGSRMRTVSYPHGKGDGRVARAAGRAGFDFGFTAGGSVFEVGGDPLLIDRRYPAAGSVEDFDGDLTRKLRAAIDPS
jgi:peptidoglycan/xylan/chitin deacetylase (PgdA/CDA1 family)